MLFFILLVFLFVNYTMLNNGILLYLVVLFDRISMAFCLLKLMLFFSNSSIVRDVVVKN